LDTTSKPPALWGKDSASIIHPPFGARILQVSHPPFGARILQVSHPPFGARTASKPPALWS
jgi:hypothetical protein